MANTTTENHVSMATSIQTNDLTSNIPKDPKRITDFSDLVRPDLKNYCPASNLAFNEKIRNLINAGQKVYHFGFGQAPFPVMDILTEALKEYAHVNAYLPVAGIPALREAIVNFHKRHDNLVELNADQVIVAPGTKQLIFLLLEVFHGDVMVISPSWTTYKPQALLSRHNPIIIVADMENEWKITPNLIEQAIEKNGLHGNKVLIMCNPDNPTGTVYKSSELKAISEVCRKHKIIVVSDEIYGRLHYTQEHDTIARYYPEGTILSTGLSKWASAGGWRLGYHIYPPELKALKEAVCSASSHTHSCAPAPMQYAAAKALSDQEACHSYILHTTRIMAAVAEFCHRELTSVGVKSVKSGGGYYLFPNFEILRQSLAKRGIMKCEQMCTAIFSEASVALMAGGPAFLRPEDEFTTRLCYVNFDGTKALQMSYQHGLDTFLQDNFVKMHCTPVHDGIKALASWVLQQLERS